MLPDVSDDQFPLHNLPHATGWASSCNSSCATAQKKQSVTTDNLPVMHANSHLFSLRTRTARQHPKLDSIRNSVGTPMEFAGEHIREGAVEKEEK